MATHRAAGISLNSDRVRRHTAEDVLRRIDERTASELTHYASADREAIHNRLSELDREWDTDRAIELEASLMGLAGLALGAWVRPALLALPLLVGGAVLTHAITGWYPLLPLFRRMGLRTAREINRERYALKALRGDFNDMEQAARRDEPSVASVASAGANRIQ